MVELISGFRWDKNLVFRTFNCQDAEKILQIPVSLSGRQDRHFWLWSENGQYTVKFGYKELSKELFMHHTGRRAEGESSTSNLNSKIWKQTWKLKIKEKN